MNGTLYALASHRLQRAYESKREGDILLEQDALAGAVNRFYYSVFYGTRALLALKEIDSSRHSGVISHFHLHFVKTGLFDRETAKILSRTFEKRQDSDYTDFIMLNRPDTEIMAREVTMFIDECRRVVEALK